MSYTVTTLMVIFSAVTATLTTVIAGGACDRVGKRKPFISVGYIVWGITIMLFALIPMRAEQENILAVGALLVVFDCLMTVAGSTSNDAAFNAWVADNTTPKNRGRLNAALSILPVAAVVIVFIGLGNLYHADSNSNRTFFIVLGLIPMLAGLLAVFALRDGEGISPSSVALPDLTDGFRLKTARANPILYVCLIACCLVGIAQQTFFSYLINFLIVTLDLGDGFVIPMAVIIVLSAALTGISGVLSDRIGRRRLYIPLWVMMVLGILSFWALQFADGAARICLLYGGGTLMMGGILSLTGMFSATFQDRIPAGAEGRYQGVRMTFTVLVPMIVGPLISLFIGLDAMGMNGDSFVPPYSIFSAAAVVAVTAILPILYIRNKSNAEI